MLQSLLQKVIIKFCSISSPIDIWQLWSTKPLRAHWRLRCLFYVYVFTEYFRLLRLTHLKANNFQGATKFELKYCFEYIIDKHLVRLTPSIIQTFVPIYCFFISSEYILRILFPRVGPNILKEAIRIRNEFVSFGVFQYFSNFKSRAFEMKFHQLSKTKITNLTFLNRSIRIQLNKAIVFLDKLSLI